MTRAPQWPQKRSDGTVSVAVRFVKARPGIADSIGLCLVDWLEAKASAGVNVLEDLLGPPTLEPCAADQTCVEVVFEGRPENRRWRDWLVEFTHVARSLDGVQVDGFHDKVSGVVRPI